MDVYFCLFLFVYLFVVCCFMSHERTFQSRGDVTVVGEGLHRFDLCSAPVAIEQGGIFIVRHLLYVTCSRFSGYIRENTQILPPFTTCKRC